MNSSARTFPSSMLLPLTVSTVYFSPVLAQFGNAVVLS